MLWPPWAVGADTDEPPVPQGPMQPPRNRELAGIQALGGGRWASTWPGLREELVDPERVLSHLPPAPPRSFVPTWQGKLLHRAGRGGALRAGACVMPPALLGQKPSPRRAEEWHGVGANSLSSEPERPRPDAASAVLCTRSVTLDSASLLLQILFSQHLIAMKPYIFEKFEELIQWTPIISSPAVMLLPVFSCLISLVNIHGCQDWDIGCVIKFQVADSFSVWAGPMQRLENSNQSGCLVFYLAALLPRTQ